MKSIETLEREHLWIGWMAETLEALIARARAEDSLPEAAYDLLVLYESFADGRHQDKEEQALFPELLAAADSGDQLLAGLQADHQAERAQLGGMRASVFGAVHGESGRLREFASRASEYLNLHRAHVFREEEALLPMAERLLTPAADERVVKGFEAIEGGAGDPHGVREQVLSLRRRAGLPGPPAA